MVATNPGGRPEIGPPIHIRLSQDLLDAVDQAALEAGVTRARMIRDLLAQALTTHLAKRRTDRDPRG